MRLRLMLLKPESKELAVQNGIEPTRCFSTRELTGSIMAQNTRVRGLIPALAAMFRSEDEKDKEIDKLKLKQYQTAWGPAETDSEEDEEAKESNASRDQLISRNL